MVCIVHPPVGRRRHFACHQGLILPIEDSPKLLKRQRGAAIYHERGTGYVLRFR
jgi:hypothetical protein